MDTVATTLPLWRRVAAVPGTSLGKRSFFLLEGFVLLLFLFFALVWLSGGKDAVHQEFIQAGGRFFYHPWFAVTLLAAALSAVLGGVAALVAIFRKGERSITMLIPLLVAGFVVYFAIGALLEDLS